MQVADTWLDHLVEQGARMESTHVLDFGDPDGELAATAGGQTIVSPLLHLASLHFTGTDTTEFLHGQLTVDIRGMPLNATTLGAYCTAKGRMLATFLLAREATGLTMLLDEAIAPMIQKRLAMYVMRSKVKIALQSDSHIIFGIAGRDHVRVLAGLGLDRPPAPKSLIRTIDDDLWWGVDADRSIGLVARGRAPAMWSAMAGQARHVGNACWRWLDINAGIPWISARTQDELVPQMVNLEMIGGISFAKGCYPGQEIVARTQHLGKIKRRMVLGNVIDQSAPQPGDPIFGADLGAQASGLVVDAAPAPTGGYDVLAVMHRSTALTSSAHLRALDGPRLALRPLPYASE
jgi:tRNA-modifying protein YgfZ